MTCTVKPRASILRFVKCAVVAGMLASAVFATQPAQAQTYNVLHSFAGGTDGKTLQASLVLDPSGNLYGTTVDGGASNSGIVFKLDTAGTETVLYTFTGGADGKSPSGGLVLDPSGNLYGTTTLGGASNSGIVFKLDTTGSETVLYTFTGGADGGSPNAPLIRDASGNLYGTTLGGGALGMGTLFKLDTTGTETVLYAFGWADGGYPNGGLVLDAPDNFYGTTSIGGGNTACSDSYFGCGVVFKLDAAGKETVLHAMGGTDGEYPTAGLTMDAVGNFYGTTNAGGASNFGTVFKLDAAGKETVLYSFGNSGSEPFGGVVLDASGNLYGTTTNGGSGFGTVFKLDMTGSKTLLHTFTGGADGAIPYAGLVLDTSGNLYGTTTAGGASNFGTVFEITSVTSDFSLASSGLTPSTVGPGGSSRATVNITTASGFSGSVTLSCSVQPSPALAPQCSISPGSITPGTPATLTVSTTGATTSTLHSGPGSEPFYALCLPLIGVVAGVGFGSDKRRKGKSRAVAMACVFLGLMFGVACGGGGRSSTGGSGGTPTGTYVISVTGTSVSVQHSTTTTLTVQ